MKIRTSFVSNSSSSSFVVIGIRVPEDKFNEMGGYEFFEETFNYVNLLWGGDEAIIGRKLASWSEGEGSINTKKFEEVMKIRDEISTTVNELCPDGKYEVELIYGRVYG
jgi:hypothetical protein